MYVPSFTPGHVVVNVTAHNMGESNNGLPEDVIIGYFDALPVVNIPGNPMVNTAAPVVYLLCSDVAEFLIDVCGLTWIETVSQINNSVFFGVYNGLAPDVRSSYYRFFPFCFRLLLP